MINQPKTAQVAAQLLSKAGGRLSVLKLMKLLYLVEREAILTRATSLTHDCPVSMPHGPVLSQSYDLASGCGEAVPNGWSEWISDQDGYDVELNPEKRAVPREDYDDLSDADIELISRIWDEFGGMSKWELRDWTHDYCAEWEDPKGSSSQIPTQKIFQAVGRSPEEATRLAREVEAERKVDSILNSL